jgi:hypothetical protein
MKQTGLFLFMGVIFSCNPVFSIGRSQITTTEISVLKVDSSIVSSFFPRADLMKIGVFYYPEQWPRDQWKRDIDNIARLGFEFTHFAEFSWTFLEPEEDRYDFSWLDGFITGVNYTDTAYGFIIPPGSEILAGENPLKPANAIVWKEQVKK